MKVDLEDLPQRSEVDRRVAERLKVAATVDSNWFDRIADMINRSAWIGSKAIGEARRCVSVELGRQIDSVRGRSGDWCRGACS